MGGRLAGTLGTPCHCPRPANAPRHCACSNWLMQPHCFTLRRSRVAASPLVLPPPPPHQPPPPLPPPPPPPPVPCHLPLTRTLPCPWGWLDPGVCFCFSSVEQSVYPLRGKFGSPSLVARVEIRLWRTARDILFEYSLWWMMMMMMMMMMMIWNL